MTDTLFVGRHRWVGVKECTINRALEIIVTLRVDFLKEFLSFESFSMFNLSNLNCMFGAFSSVNDDGLKGGMKLKLYFLGF